MELTGTIFPEVLGGLLSPPAEEMAWQFPNLTATPLPYVPSIWPPPGRFFETYSNYEAVTESLYGRHDCTGR